MVEQNKALVRRWIDEVLTRGDVRLVDELFAPNYVLHDPGFAYEVRGGDGIKRFAATFRAASPDVRFAVEDQIAEGDMVVTRWTARGTHQGELFGVPPSGNRVEVAGITVSRIEGSKIVEEWDNYDALGMMQQIGAIPEQ